jgi:hypothetical protein
MHYVKHEMNMIYCLSLETTRTAFRVQHGFDLFNTHKILCDCRDEQLTASIFNLMNLLSNADGRLKLCARFDATSIYCSFRWEYAAMFNKLFSLKLFQQANLFNKFVTISSRYIVECSSSFDNSWENRCQQVKQSSITTNIMTNNKQQPKLI